MPDKRLRQNQSFPGKICCFKNLLVFSCHMTMIIQCVLFHSSPHEQVIYKPV